MNPERIAQWTLAGYLAVAAALIVWQMARCPAGPTIWWFHVLNRLYCGLVYRWRSNGRSPYPNRGPALIIANHRSPLDPIFLWMNMHLGRDGTHALRPIGFMMAREYYEMRGLRWAFRALRSIPVERSGRDMASARDALRHLADGDLVGVFPEGRLNRRPENVVLDANTGIAWLALRAEVPVYPVYIHGAPRCGDMIRPFFTLSHVRVVYGEPVDLSPWRDRKKTQDVLREVTDLLMTRLAELGGATYLGTAAAEPTTLPLERATG